MPRVCFDRFLPSESLSAEPELSDAQKMARASTPRGRPSCLENSGLTTQRCGCALWAAPRKTTGCKDFRPQVVKHMATSGLISTTHQTRKSGSPLIQRTARGHISAKTVWGIPLNQATMNLGWQDEGVVLHEFGHTLGFIHEHQNPEGGIQWESRQRYQRSIRQSEFLALGNHRTQYVET